MKLFCDLKCCFCYDIQSGALMISYAQILAIPIALLGLVHSSLTRPGSVFQYLMIVWLVYGLNGYLLLLGIKKEKEISVKTYMFCQACLTLALLFFSFIGITNKSPTTKALGYFFFIYLIPIIYFYLVVKRYCRLYLGPIPLE